MVLGSCFLESLFFGWLDRNERNLMEEKHRENFVWVVTDCYEMKKPKKHKSFCTRLVIVPKVFFGIIFQRF